MTPGLSTRRAPPLDIPFRFLAVTVSAFALMVLLYPWHIPLLLGSFYDSHLTTFVHVNTLGVIAATIFGASYQLLPVVLQAPLGSVRLARLSWWLYVPGVVCFLGGLPSGALPVLAAGGTLVFGAICLYLVVVVGTLARERRPGIVSWHVAASTVGLGYAALLGLLLALSKRLGFLEEMTLPVLGAHATLMLGGWVAPLHMGVAYRLVGMFTLAEDALRVELAVVGLAAAVGGAWTLAASLLFGLGDSVALVGAAGVLVGQVLFVAQLVWLYRHRRRRAWDVHAPFALAAGAFALAAAGLLVFGFATRRPATDALWIAAGWWAIAGWAQTSIQGFFYKIATFLTWLHRYAPLAGPQRVPRLEDLYGPRLARFGWATWVTGAALAGASALTGSLRLALTAAVLLSLGGGSFVANALRIGRHWLGGAAVNAAKERSAWGVPSRS